MKRLILFLFIVTVSMNAVSESLPFKKFKNPPYPQPRLVAYTGEKPQTKLWQHSGFWWAVLPSKGGTWVWRLDTEGWTQILNLSPKSNIKADCLRKGNLVHILLFEWKKPNNTQLTSIQLVKGKNPTYKFWEKRKEPIPVPTNGSEIATICMDSIGRLWVGYDANIKEQKKSRGVFVRYAESPYMKWSESILLAKGIAGDDICVVFAFGGNKTGVLWSNQRAKRFGFRFRKDETPPGEWQKDEIPSSQSALTIGGGMADDHLNVASTSDGTLYCAVKTSYDTSGQPLMGLLKRHPDGKWDPLYTVSTGGTRPIVLIQEKQKKLFYIFSRGIKTSNLENLNFTNQPQATASGNNVTSTRDLLTDSLVIVGEKGTTVFQFQPGPP